MDLDPLRYYLIKDVSFGNDGKYITKKDLEDCVNSDLANNYGNLMPTCHCFCRKKLFLINT